MDSAAPESNIRIDKFKEYIRRGWPIFPVQANDKKPILKDWQDRATLNLATIKEWDRKYPNCNWGIHLGGCTPPLTVVDMDGDDGIQNYTAGGEVATLTATTPRGGMHAYYVGTTPNTVGKLAEHVDTRSAGGYVLAPGVSTINSRPYEWTTETWCAPKVEDLPEFVDRATKREEARAVFTDIELDGSRSIELAARYLEQCAPESIQGCGGDHAAYVTACGARDFGISEDTCLQLMLTHWNDQKASPPWDENELRVKVRNAYKFATQELGTLSPESRTAEAAQVFDAVPVPGLGGFNPREMLDQGEPPPRRWLIENWLPGEINTHTYFTGRGGTGKSLLALQMAIAVGGGATEFMGAKVCEHRPVLMVCCEDSYEDLRHRLWAMKQHEGMEESLRSADLQLVSRAGDSDNLLVVQDNQVLKKGGFWEVLKQGILDMPPGPKLVVLDTVGDVYGADQNDNQLVQQFLKMKLNALAKATHATFLLIGHPAKDKTSEFGGAVAWENGVRNRLFLGHQDPDDPGKRMVLSRAKSNWVGPGDKILVEFEAGLMVKVDQVEEQDDNDDAVYAAVQKADAAGRRLNRRGKTQSIYTAPIKVNGRNLTRVERDEAMDRLQLMERVLQSVGSGPAGLAGFYVVQPNDIFD
jgi:hypothetical protein